MHARRVACNLPMAQYLFKQCKQICTALDRLKLWRQIQEQQIFIYCKEEEVDKQIRASASFLDSSVRIFS